MLPPSGSCARLELGHHLVELNEAARQMERAFERAALGGRHGRKSVAAQIAIPLAVGWIGKMLLAVIERFEEPVKILLVSSVAVEHHGGNENFVMRPPELHIVLI